MPVKRPLLEKQEGWRRGEVKAVESQKIPLDALKKSENWERDLDGSLVSSPGFDTEFTVGLHRQIADMEDGEDSRWGGALVDDLVNFQYGFQSRQHQHVGVGALNSTFTRPLTLLGDVFNTTTDQINFRFNADDVSELSQVEIRFRRDAANYFSIVITPSGWDDGVWQLEQVLQSAFTTVNPGAALTWNQVVDMFVESTSQVSGVVNLSFDDFFILRPADTVGEAIWNVHGFERVSTPERYLMVASGSEIWSYLGTVATKRLTSQNAARPVNMMVANDMVIAANGSDNIKRWNAGDSTFRDLGVPIPPDTIVGTEANVVGNVLAGIYFFATVFDMGIHGEGNSISPAGSSVTIVTGPDRIDYTNVPIGSPGTIRRLIYRTVDGGTATGALRLDVIVNNNIDTTAQSNVADVDLGATLAQDGNQPPIGSMLVHANRTLFLAGVPGSESSVFFSDTTRAANRTIEQWRVTNEFRLNPDDGDRITGMIYFRRFIYIFKRRSTWMLDPINLGSPVMISSTYGSIGHRCLVDGGSVLYAWSDEHGPLEIIGQGITPIGILESNLEREGPRVGDVNGNTQATAGILGPIITTQTDFEAGRQISTSTTEVIGSVVLGRSSLPGRSRTTNLSTLSGASAVATISGGDLIEQLNNIDGGKDGVVEFAPGGTNWVFATNTSATFSGTYTLTLFAQTTISKVRLWLGTFAGFATAQIGTVPLPLVNVQYETSPGSFAGIAGFVSRQIPVNPDTANMNDFSYEFNFSPVTTRRIRITFAVTVIANSPSNFRTVYLGDLQVFEAGFSSSGHWTSAIQNLGQTPSSWGRFNARFLLRPTGSLTFYMRSAATSGELGASSIIPWQQVIPGISPDTTLIPLNQFIEFLVAFTSSAGDETPRLDDLSILFTSAASDFIRPRFESAGILFDRRYWLSAVSRDDTNPTLVWKYQQLLKSWSRHPGFNMSSWTRLSEDFYSGSATDGRVYRNVVDANGEIIRTHAGSDILCLAKTKDSAPTGQDHTNTILDFAVVCRNEDSNRKNLVRNYSFEDWPDDLTPAGWGSAGSIREGQRLSMETDPRHISDRSASLKIDWSNPSRGIFIFNRFISVVVPNNVDLISFQDISLEPNQDYILTFYAKKDDGFPMNIFRIQDFRSDGNHQFLREDGTWGALVDEFLGDNATITETVARRLFSFRTNAPDPNHVFYRIQFGYLISTTGNPGTTWIDDVTLFEAPLSTPRFIHVLPILDGKEDLPERSINITGDSDGILDVGVIRKGFRIDKAQVKNVGFRFRHEDPESGAKILALYVNSTPEEWRQ